MSGSRQHVSKFYRIYTVSNLWTPKTQKPDNGNFQLVFGVGSQDVLLCAKIGNRAAARCCALCEVMGVVGVVVAVEVVRRGGDLVVEVVDARDGLEAGQRGIRREAIATHCLQALEKPPEEREGK